MKFKIKHCPICFSQLEIRECAPCFDCGHLPEEIEHLKNRVHHYDEYEVFEGMSLILCDYCRLDFLSYNPGYFDLKESLHKGVLKMNFIKTVENPKTFLDGYCPNCQRRLEFLDFLKRIRERFNS